MVRVSNMLVAVLLLAGVNQATYAQIKRYSARISVKGELKKDRETSKNESEKKSAKTTTEKQHYELDVTVANTGKEDESYTLEWYFFKCPLGSDGEGDPELASKGSEKISLAAMKRLNKKVVSETLEWKDSKSSSNSSKGNDSGKKKGGPSGNVYDGYLVVLRADDGSVITTNSNNKRYTTDEWLGKVGFPVE